MRVPPRGAVALRHFRLRRREASLLAGVRAGAARPRRGGRGGARLQEHRLRRGSGFRAARASLGGRGSRRAPGHGAHPLAPLLPPDLPRGEHHPTLLQRGFAGRGGETPPLRPAEVRDRGAPGGGGLDLRRGRRVRRRDVRGSRGDGRGGVGGRPGQPASGRVPAKEGAKGELHRRRRHPRRVPPGERGAVHGPSQRFDTVPRRPRRCGGGNPERGGFAGGGLPLDGDAEHARGNAAGREDAREPVHPMEAALRDAGGPRAGGDAVPVGDVHSPLPRRRPGRTPAGARSAGSSRGRRRRRRRTGSTPFSPRSARSRWSGSRGTRYSRSGRGGRTAAADTNRSSSWGSP